MSKWPFKVSNIKLHFQSSTTLKKNMTWQHVSHRSTSLSLPLLSLFHSRRSKEAKVTSWRQHQFTSWPAELNKTAAGWNHIKAFQWPNLDTVRCVSSGGPLRRIAPSVLQDEREVVPSHGHQNKSPMLDFCPKADDGRVVCCTDATCHHPSATTSKCL